MPGAAPKATQTTHRLSLSLRTESNLYAGSRRIVPPSREGRRTDTHIDAKDPILST